MGKVFGLLGTGIPLAFSGEYLEVEAVWTLIGAGGVLLQLRVWADY